jgi:hypothetical protein
MDSYTSSYSACLISSDGTIHISDSVTALSIECAYAGNGGSVFLSQLSFMNGAQLLTGFSVLDTVSGQIKAPASLQENIDGIIQVPFHAQSIAADGSAALLAMRQEDGNGNSLGSSLAIVRADGSAVKLPLSGDYLPIDCDSIKLSPDGSSFTGKNGDAWARYSSTDGTLLETLSAEPADASPLWSACVLDSFKAYPSELVAGANMPGGTATVSAAVNGKNTDLEITDGAVTRWITGPESEDVE